MSATYVTCARTAFVVSTEADIHYGQALSLHLSPILAWKIDTYQDLGALGEPVTTESLPKIYAIYFADTLDWIVPNDTTGTGLGELLSYFESN